MYAETCVTESCGRNKKHFQPWKMVNQCELFFLRQNMTKFSDASPLNVFIFLFLSSSVTVTWTSCVGSCSVVLRLKFPPVTYPSSARLRQLGGVRAPAGEAQRRPRLPPPVPLRKLPSLHRGWPGPAGPLVPRISWGGLHAPAGIQGKHLALYLSQKVIHGVQDFREFFKKLFIYSHSAILWWSWATFCFSLQLE